MNHMNENKICFITCINDEIKHQKMLGYFTKLEVPADFETEVVTITERGGMAAGYNQGMQSSDAKYKVYVTQDTLITNRYFIRDVIKIFNQDKSIGIIGVLGTEIIPTSAICEQTQNRMGKIKEINSEKILSWKNPENLYGKVQAIDGVLMITQYDIPWREDIFAGEYYYDLAQSIEFARKNYHSIVVRQEEPWCIANYSNFKNDSYEEDRNLFLDEYSKDIYPLVSILIPTYNRPEYFKIAIESAINQTYRNIEIIVGDGSTDNRTEKLIQTYLENKKIKYFHDQVTPSGERWKKMYLDAKGRYVNWLMDDDVFHIDKITMMVNFYIENEDVNLVTSYRRIIDKDGNICSDIGATKKICDQTTIFDGKILGNYLLKNLINFIGEPTSVLIRKDSLPEWGALYLGHDFAPCTVVDVFQWLILLSRGKAVYITNELSYFRIHDRGNQNNSNVAVIGTKNWFEFITRSYEAGIFLNTKADLREALRNWLVMAFSTMKMVHTKGDDDILKQVPINTCLQQAFEMLN